MAMMTQINKHRHWNGTRGVYRFRKWGGCGNYMRRKYDRRRFSRDEVLGWRLCMIGLVAIDPDVRSSALSYWGRNPWKLFMTGRVSGYRRLRHDMSVPLSRYTKRPDISTYETS
jgi:hypothetical protein